MKKLLKKKTRKKEKIGTLDFLTKGCPLLRALILPNGTSTQPWTPESWAHLKAFKTKLLAENRNVKMTFV